MSQKQSQPEIRRRLSPNQRNYEPSHHIDAGFLNERLLQVFVPQELCQAIEERFGQSSQLHAHFRDLQRDHDYIRVALLVAATRKARSSLEVLASAQCCVDDVVCSTDRILGDNSVYTDNRVCYQIHTNLDVSQTMWLDFSPRHIKADTTRMEICQRSPLSYIGVVREVHPDRIVVAPLVIGAPWLNACPDLLPDFGLIWTHGEFFENFVEDIDEFQRVAEVERDEAGQAWKVLKEIPESNIKQAICSMLRESAAKDWGGERSDHFSSSLHLSGRRVTAAFLLKGPARFSVMKATHLGKNGDQITRLASEPAELLILQHSHLVSPPVRDTLRAFAVKPSAPRRYCVIDGPDTYRLLKAYGLLPPQKAANQPLQPTSNKKRVRASRKSSSAARG